MDLINLQNQFIDGVYDKKQKHILSSIKNGKASKIELFEIYRNNLKGGLIGALKITYPEVSNFLKEEKFKEFALKFINKNRSQTGNLDDYGENFYQVLKSEKEYFLSDLARLEWLKQKAYLAEDASLIDNKKLQLLSEDKLFLVKFDLHPSCSMLISSYNLLSKRKQTKILKNPAYFVVYRHDLEIKVSKVSKGEFNFIKGIKENLSLYQIYNEYKPNIGLCLSKNLSNGLITGFEA